MYKIHISCKEGKKKREYTTLKSKNSEKVRATTIYISREEEKRKKKEYTIAKLRNLEKVKCYKK